MISGTEIIRSQLLVAMAFLFKRINTRHKLLAMSRGYDILACASATVALVTNGSVGQSMATFDSWLPIGTDIPMISINRCIYEHLCKYLCKNYTDKYINRYATKQYSVLYFISIWCFPSGVYTFQEPFYSDVACESQRNLWF